MITGHTMRTSTGRINYRDIGAIIGMDLGGQPDLDRDPVTAAKVAFAFWDARGRSELVDAGDVDSVTDGIKRPRRAWSGRTAGCDAARYGHLAMKQHMQNNKRRPTSLLLKIAVWLVCLHIPGFVFAEEQTTSPNTPGAFAPKPDFLQLAPGASQDTQFFALLRARDTKFGLVQELKRIITYHDGLKDRLEQNLGEEIVIIRLDRDKDDIKETFKKLIILRKLLTKKLK